MIPKIVHYIWVGPKPLPEEDRLRIVRWRELLPDWEIRAWGNDQVDFASPYLRMAYAMRAWNRVSDYMRMDILARFGGVYLDTDIDLIKPLDPLLDQTAFLGFQAGDELPGELVNGAVIGAVPDHWLPKAIRSYFDEQLDGRTDIGAFAGPGLLTLVLREHGLRTYSEEPAQVRDVTLYPKPWFYPYSWEEIYSEAVITPQTYTVHRWALTWVPVEDVRFRLRRKFLTLLGRHSPRIALWLSRNVAERAAVVRA